MRASGNAAMQQRRVLIVGFISLLLYVRPAVAQTNAPTDRELLAGYCLGVTRERAILDSNPAFPVPKTKEFQEAYERAEQRLERDRQRFLGYLLGDTNMDWTGVLIAGRNGEEDVRDAVTEGTADCPLNLPTLQEELKLGPEWADAETAKRIKLSRECGDRVPAHQRLVRCDQPDLLPF